MCSEIKDRWKIKYDFTVRRDKECPLNKHKKDATDLKWTNQL